MEPFRDYFESPESAIGVDALGGLNLRGSGRIKSPEIASVLGAAWRAEYYETFDGQRWTVFTNGRLWTGAHRSSLT